MLCHRKGLSLVFFVKLGFIGEDVTETPATGARGVSIPPEPPEKAPAIWRDSNVIENTHSSRRAIWREPFRGVWGV